MHLILSFLAFIGPVALVVGHASASGSQAVVGMPFSGKWAYNSLVSPPYTDTNSSHPSVHHTPGGGDWATDVYAAEGTAVKLSVPTVTGALTLSWKTTSTSCGQSTGVNIIVDGTTTGWLYFAHLNNAVTSGTITNGMTLGAVHDWVVSGVHCNPGVHVHTEFKNTTNYSCYVDNGQPGVTLSADANFAVIGSSNTGAQQACTSIPTVGGIPSSSVFDFNSEENVIARGTNNESYINSWGTSWSGFNTMQSGATFAGNPTGIKYGSEGKVFVRGATTTNEIYESTWNGSSWGAFGSLQSGATFASDPVAIQFDTSVLNLFAIGTDGQMYEISKSPGWGTFSLLQSGSYFVGNPTVLKFNSKEYVFARGTNNEIYVNTWTSGSGWSGFTSLGTGYTFASDPAVIQYGSVLNVFARGTDNQMYVNYLDTSWHPFGLIQSGAYFSSNPTVAQFGTEEKVFARGISTNNEIYENTWNGSSWSGFGSLQTGATFAGNPVAIQYGTVLNVFARGTDNQMHVITKNPGWSTFSLIQSGAYFNGFSWQ